MERGDLLRVVDAVTSAGLALRLTRFVVIEELGDWLIHEPAQRWAHPTDWDRPVRFPVKWRLRLVTGLDCPFCVGTWLQLGALGVDQLLPRHGVLRAAWRVLAISQTAAYLLGHLGSRLGDAGYQDSP